MWIIEDMSQEGVKDWGTGQGQVSSVECSALCWDSMWVALGLPFPVLWPQVEE